MSHQFCKNNAGKIFPAWNFDKEEFSRPTIKLISYKKLRAKVVELNSDLKEEKFAILIDEKSGPTIIEKKDLPIELQKYLKPFPLKFQ